MSSNQSNTTAVKPVKKVAPAPAPAPAVATEELVFDQPKVKVIVHYEATLEELREHCHRLDREPYASLPLPAMGTITLNLSAKDYHSTQTCSDGELRVSLVAQSLTRLAGESVAEAMDKAHPEIALKREMEELRRKAEAYDRMVAEQRAREAEAKAKTEARVKKMVASKKAKKDAETASVASSQRV
jgi:hypothetical protein